MYPKYCVYEGIGVRRGFSHILANSWKKSALPMLLLPSHLVSSAHKNVWHVFARIKAPLHWFWICGDFQVVLKNPLLCSQMSVVVKIDLFLLCFRDQISPIVLLYGWAPEEKRPTGTLGQALLSQHQARNNLISASWGLIKVPVCIYTLDCICSC